jgi:hypothetical protein
MMRTFAALGLAGLLTTVALFGVSLSAAPGGTPSPSIATLQLASDFAPSGPSSEGGEGAGAASNDDPLFWLNHFDLLPGGDELTTSYASTSSGVGGGLTALVVESSTTGDVFSDGGNKVVQMAVSVPPGYGVTGVQLCYELTANTSFVSQIRLAQVQNPPSSATVLLDDATNLTDLGPICVDSASTGSPIDPSAGALLLDLRFNFGDTADKVAVRGVALHLVEASTENVLWTNHFDLLPGGDELTTSYASTSSGVGGGLTGLVIESSSTGEEFADGGSKVVQMAVSVPPGFTVSGVRVCYELTSNASVISQVRLAQVQSTPSTALVMLDDGTDLTDVGPSCTDSSATTVSPSVGALLLSLRVNFSDTADKIVIRGVALLLEESVAGSLADLQDLVASLDPSVFSNKNHKNTFLNKLNAVSNQIDGDSLCDAVDKLTNDLLKKTDGEGSPPDWVIDATAQQALEDAILALIDALAAEAGAQGLDCGTTSAVVWLNHFDLLAGDDELITTYASTSSGVGGGLTALVIQSETTGDVFGDGGNKVVQMAVEVPSGFTVAGVRVCYELTSNGSYINQVRLAQVDNPPSSASVLLDDATNQTDVGPVCVDTTATSVDPTTGALLLSLRLNFGDTADKIAIRGVALLLENA